MLQSTPSIQIVSGFEIVTPLLAAEMLTHDKRVRKLDIVSVRKYASDMEKGLWRLNGESISFNESGELVDGRKRLHACIESNRSFRTLVVRNIPNNSSLTVDSRKKRGIGDVLTIAGHKSGGRIATTLGLLLCMSQGRWNRKTVSNQHMRAMLAQHPDIIRSLKHVDHKGRIGSWPLHAAVHYIFSRIDQAEADDFFSGLYAPDAAVLGRYDARRALSRRFAAAKEMKVPFTYEQAAAMAVLAWNAVQEGREIRDVRKISWEMQDEFPEIAYWSEEHAVRISETSMQMEVRRNTSSDDADLEVGVEWVDSATAAEWLVMNTVNRSLSSGKVESYNRDMLSDGWQLNGESVKFSSTGRMLDGQHRLQAIVKSGQTVPLLVVRGLDESVYDTYDTGQKRSYADVLRERGFKNWNPLQGALGILVCIENDRHLSGFLATNHEREDALQRHPGILENSTIDSKNPMEPSMAIVLRYLFGLSNEAKAEEFFQKMGGIGSFNETDPVRHLRERLLAKRVSNATGQTSPYQRIVLGIVAWNAFKAGKKMKKLTLPVSDKVYPNIA